MYGQKPIDVDNKIVSIDILSDKIFDIASNSKLVYRDRKRVNIKKFDY